jgi:hypothetical protein
VLRAAGCSVAASVAFFAVSNFRVWAFGGFYAKSAAGLAECYVAAIPFYRNTVLGDLSWTIVFFGLYSLVTRGMPWTEFRSLIMPGRIIPEPIA